MTSGAHKYSYSLEYAALGVRLRPLLATFFSLFPFILVDLSNRNVLILLGRVIS